LKRRLGKLAAPGDWLERAPDFRRLAITVQHATAAGELPLHHRDPFDRMLVAQAQVEGMTLVTDDERMDPYDVHTLSPA
jgi:PIN domain nuclease of toxin-antitoxin system